MRVPPFCDFQTGTGRPLLFLHGSLWSGAVFLPLLRRWRPRRPWLLMDLPGQNRHAVEGGGPLDQDAAAAAIATALDGTGLDEVDVVGHSQGALLAFLLAAMRPALVRSVASIAATVLPEPVANVPGLNQLNQRIAAEGTGNLSDFLVELFISPTVRGDPDRAAEVADWRAQLGSHPPAVARAIAGVIDRKDLRPMLPGVRQPVLIIECTRDERISPTDRAALAQALPRAERRLLDCAHLGLVEHPDLFVEPLARFLT